MWIDTNSDGKPDAGGITDLQTLGGSESEALDINDNSQIVGWANNSSGYIRAFLYENGFMNDLNNEIYDSSWVLEEARAINNLGNIVGIGKHNGSDKGFFAEYIYNEWTWHEYEPDTPGLYDKLEDEGTGWKLTKKNLDPQNAIEIALKQEMPHCYWQTIISLFVLYYRC